MLLTVLFRLGTMAQMSLGGSVLHREDDAQSRGPKKCTPKTTGTCTFSKNGNINAGFKNHTINWGTFNPTDIADVIASQCTGGGCFPSTVKRPSQVISQGEVHDAVLSIKLSAAFDGANRGNLIDAIRAATKATTASKRVQGIRQSDGQETIKTQYRHSPQFRVYMPVTGAGNVSPNIQVAVTVHEINDSDDGYCKEFSSIGNAVNAGLGEVSGAGLALAVLQCF